jgi:hypothetical protein
LQKYAKKVANIIRGMLIETFGAVAALQQECSASCDFSKLTLEITGFACKNEGWETGKLIFYFRQSSLISIDWRLLDW